MFVNSLKFNLILFLSLSFTSQVYAETNWKIERKNGVQFLIYNTFGTMIRPDFWTGLTSDPSIRFDLPTVLVIKSGGGDAHFGPLRAIHPRGNVYNFFSRIEEESEVPIHILNDEYCLSYC